jgi:hypothetical protein
MSAEIEGGSWLPRSNFVDRSALEIRPSEEFGVTEEVVEKARERTEEFIDEYPDRARLPMTRDPDETLLASYVVEEYREEHVEPDGEFGTGFTVTRLDRAVPVSWAEAFFLTLIDRHQYDGGVSGRFLDRESGEEFGVQFSDAWTADYAKEQQAKTAGAQRQLMGGEYPENHEQSARSGEYEPGEWENPVSVLGAFTGSSVPAGQRLPPVDHARTVDTWTSAAYDCVRNLIEHKWGVPSDRWGYMRSEDVHGLDDGHETNAGYTHTHPAVFFDVAEADLPDLSESELEAVIQQKFLDDVVSKHVEECEIAEESAHGPDSVTVSFGIEKPGAYAAAYALPGEEKPLIDRPVEYIAWATTMRAMGRQRIARSKLFTEAAKADMCKQDADRTHGGRLEYDHGGHNTKLVCACCGSPVGIGETMTAHRADEAKAVAADGGEVVDEETTVIGARVGESSDRAGARETAERYVQRHGAPEEVTPGLLGEMGVPPAHADVVSETIKGEDSSGVEPVKGQARGSGTSRYELQELTAWNGDTETPNGGGGARYVEVEMPVEELIRRTRLQHVGPGARPKIVVHVDGERVATHNPQTAARKLVNAGLRIPWVADRSLEFVESEAPEFEEPVEPPTG